MTPRREFTNAVQMTACGGPEVLAFGPMALAPLLPNEVRINTIASAVNHTDLKTDALPPRYTRVPLAEAARAHAVLESRGECGRVLLVP